jgi:energy-converting hydrogenase Eha subunit E
MSRDLRGYARNTNVRLAVGAFFLLFVIGVGLIYLVYGKAAALLGFFCLLAAMLPIVLILLFLLITDWIVKRAGRE